jgi:hypothetical protein
MLALLSLARMDPMRLSTATSGPALAVAPQSIKPWLVDKEEVVAVWSSLTSIISKPPKNMPVE